ncbi:hypothetical protein P3T76_005839 [Phytophthora citrophthora]|uniref:Uncharacterized protein n=1 Tax=Phytophthora citrophthora TaxID=4793 RepID=A0AAD9GPE4_9STRA|nr:hypothetical protein P3T76_005839 [Phytophthora citrophthora]
MARPVLGDKAAAVRVPGLPGLSSGCLSPRSSASAMLLLLLLLLLWLWLNSSRWLSHGEDMSSWAWKGDWRI